MQYFVDSADVRKIETILERFPCDGVTTNPTILAREAADDPAQTLLAIRSLIGKKLLFAQVTATDWAGMVCEAKVLRERLGEPLSIKIPATPDGLRAIMLLSGEGYSVTATAVYSTQQVLLCAKAGARFVAPYVSHIDNYCVDSVDIIGNMASLLKTHTPQTQVLAASFRVAEQINRVILAGAGAVTIAPEMFDKLIESAGTEAEVAAFRQSFNHRFGEKGIADFFD